MNQITLHEMSARQISINMNNLKIQGFHVKFLRTLRNGNADTMKSFFIFFLNYFLLLLKI